MSDQAIADAKQKRREIKQAENGPRWRHIQGSKIAKGLQSAKKTLHQNFENDTSEL